MFLSKIEGSPSLEVVNMVLEKRSKGEDVLSLAIGDPSSGTPREIIEKAYEAMISGDVHYVSSYGTPEVRDAICSKVLRVNRIRADPEETIFLTTKFSVFAALFAISESPYEALVPDPGYFYSEPVILSGGTPVNYKLNPDFSLDMDEIRRKTSHRTKTIIINSPSNPTGRVLERRELEELYDFCVSRGILIIADEAYEDITYGSSTKHFAVGSLESHPEVVISLFSLSKSYSMTGWRAGYVVASKRIAHLMNKFLENVVTCLPPFIEKASAHALNNGDRFISQFRNEYMLKRKIVVEELGNMPALDLNDIQGSFYAFPRLRSSRISSTDFSRRLLASQNVAVLPGTAFGPSGEGRFRISFSVGEDALREGLKRIKSFLSSNVF